MENKRFNKGLVTLLAAGAIAITSGLGGCNDNKKTPNIYQEIAIEFNKDIDANRIDANRIDPNNVSDEDIDYMYEVMRSKYGPK
jgi:hypothetical protein